MPLLRHPPHRVDLSLTDWLAAALALARGDEQAARTDLEHRWAPEGDGLSFLAVRSAFDCALGALAWPPGSEVLVSAVNIQDMVELLTAHGLRPVPLPLEPRTLLPSPEALIRAITPRTRGVLVAHLFGARADLGPLFRAAHARGLVCFEDAAQAFADPGDRGAPDADLTMFSFGTIKTATALGGALVRVADPELRARMAALQASWPRQPRRAYAGRVARALGFLALHTAVGYTLFSGACRLVGVEPAAAIRRMSRGFAGLGPAAFLAAIRRRPCAALLRVLERRIRRFGGKGARRLAARRAWGLEIARVAAVPGAAHRVHSHWLVPIQVDDPGPPLAALRAAGIDVTGPSNLVDLDPAAPLVADLVFIPAYPELPARARAAVLAALGAPAASRALPREEAPC